MIASGGSTIVGIVILLVCGIITWRADFPPENLVGAGVGFGGAVVLLLLQFASLKRAMTSEKKTALTAYRSV